tara:strand:+ start:52636 stop:53019 length:384 start_codon:yes stop_codon:yes gene_type:complete
MLKKGNKLYSILTGTCPKCQEESMYLNKNPYYLGQIYKMQERCSHCNVKYKIEPSFFYGAMYVSYGLGVGISVAAFIISFVFIGLSLVLSFAAIIGVLILLMPMIMRLSRNIWINFFISYDPNAVSN